MIGLKQKSLQTILESLEGKNKLVLMGCGGCASMCRVGGEAEVEAMAETLTKKGKEVVVAIPVPLGQATCHAPESKERLEIHSQQIAHSDAMLMLCCGCGVQMVGEILVEDLGMLVPLYPAADAVGDMMGGPDKFEETCIQCGECIVADFAGLCPISRCPKRLLNGPCAGDKMGKCEQDPNHECVWLTIYERLKQLGQLDKLNKILPPLNYGKTLNPRSLEIT